MEQIKNEVTRLFNQNAFETETQAGEKIKVVESADFEDIAVSISKIVEKQLNAHQHRSKMICECLANERVALDCTSKECKHPKYNK